MGIPVRLQETAGTELNSYGWLSANGAVLFSTTWPRFNVNKSSHWLTDQRISQEQSCHKSVICLWNNKIQYETPFNLTIYTCWLPQFAMTLNGGHDVVRCSHTHPNPPTSPYVIILNRFGAYKLVSFGMVNEVALCGDATKRSMPTMNQSTHTCARAWTHIHLSRVEV